MSSTDRIEKQLMINAPRAKVWRAISDSQEFGKWFRVAIEGPFVAGQSVRGRILTPGYDHVHMTMEIVAVDATRGYFAYRWHPFAIDAKVDYSGEPTTLVEFQLSETGSGTKVAITESGFDGIPAHRRDEAFRMNTMGWEAQLKNIEAHVAT